MLRSSKPAFGKKGQSSIEFIFTLPVILLITMFVVGEYSLTTQVTMAMATGKESFYEKTIDLNESVLLKDIDWIVCTSTLKLNFTTIPTKLGPQETDLNVVLASDIPLIEADALSGSGFADIDISINDKQPACT